MNRAQKTATLSLWGLMVVAIIAMVVGGFWGRSRYASRFNESEADPLPPIPVPAFSLSDQDGKTVTLDQLKGRVWAADFIFTRCMGPCPLMTQRMLLIQKTLGDADVQLVSFSVDPTYDTPPVLKTYARERGVDERNWRLLTGDNQVIIETARKMHLGVMPPGSDGHIGHSTYFVLIDREGLVHGYYSGQDDEGWRKLVADAIKLSATGQQKPAGSGT